MIKNTIIMNSEYIKNHKKEFKGNKNTKKN